MKLKLVLTLSLVTSLCLAQEKATENIFLITLDGLRWQELFNGADSLLIDDSGYVDDPEALVEEFWHDDPLERRKMLMPFFWSTIAEQGQLLGNRMYGNKVDCSNYMWFSYPGYSEILCGFADDDRIKSNDKIQNPNVTVLEWLNNQPEFKGGVAAFGSWDVFPYIINEERSGVPVNAGFEKALDNPTEKETFLNRLQDEIRGPWGTVRLDVFTHHYAMEYLKNNSPRVLYVAYGETDDWAHGGDYDQYLKSARQTDAYIKELWDYAQSNDQYQGKTTMIITTDHGRGTHPKSTWRNHGTRIPDAGEIWIATLGPGFPAMGEVKDERQSYQNQVARTVVELLGKKYDNPKAGSALTISRE